MATKDLIPSADVVIAAKRKALTERKSRTPIEAVRALASMQKRPQPILSAISYDDPIMLIGQVKYTQSDNGLLNEPYDPVSTAVRYARAGVDAIALFTDETLYQGGLDDLVLVSRAVQTPIISQDYILDEYQVVEARAAGASALILSSAHLEPPLLRTLVSATQRNRMTAIVEVRTVDELTYALSLSPHVIGLSNRDPWTLDVSEDKISRLRSQIPAQTRVMITDTLPTLDKVEQAIRLGVVAVLVPDVLLSDPDTSARLLKLVKREPL